MVTLKRLSLFLVSLALTSCAAAPKKHDIQVWFANADKAAIERQGKTVECKSTEFRPYICLHESKFKELHNACVEKNTPWWKFWK